jgi:multiple sugar transport system substrate-binding protein
MFASVFGGGFYDSENEKLTIDTPENLRALAFLAEQHRQIGFEKMLRFQSSLATDSGADWPFASGKKSITIEGQWRVQQLKKFAPDIPYVTAPIPPPAKGGKTKAGWVHGNFMIIPRGAKNPQGAWAFIKFWTGQNNPEQAAGFYTRAGWLPPNPQIAATGVYQAYVHEHPQFQTFVDQLDSPNLEPTPPVPFQLQLFDLIKQTDDSAMRGSLPPKQALKQLEEKVNAVIQRREEFSNEK